MNIHFLLCLDVLYTLTDNMTKTKSLTFLNIITQDTAGIVTQIASYLRYTLTDDVIDKVVEGSSLGSMKKRFHNYLEKDHVEKFGPQNLVRKGRRMFYFVLESLVLLL